MSAEDENHRNAKMCWFCEEVLGDDKMRNDCHFMGRYRGLANTVCNLKHWFLKYVRVSIHNLAGYDAHIFLQKLGVTKGQIRCIPNSQES